MRRRYRSYSSKIYFYKKEIDFTDGYLDYNQFLLQEFFVADCETKENILDSYRSIYGNRSLGYLKSKYLEWANGNYHLTDLIRGRILAMMPKLLNDQAKHKLGIHDFVYSIKESIKSFQVSQKTIYKNYNSSTNLQDISRVFQQEYDRIQELKINRFRFNVLTEEEKIEVIEVCKYILEIKLEKAFAQIKRDIEVFLPYMSKFKIGVFSAKYYIAFCNIVIDFAKVDSYEIDNFKLNIHDIEVDGRFKMYADKYLAYELVGIQKEVKQAIGDSFLNSNDVQVLIKNYEELLGSDYEIEMASVFQGEGGKLQIKVQLKPLAMIKTSILFLFLRVFLYIACVIGAIFFVIKYNLLALLFYFGIFLGVMIYNLIRSEIKQFKSLKKELKIHGR
ncbi:hypothetical protein GCM10023172_10670 [Hymenobacter ginsengisoli]|uniref:Uncharacterized protein n=1 Tax=Hymenobacter ginsengisoli TaxID=1051626 RepID=A0ABP8Q546_9BACT|nr:MULTISPECIES: hypothetical protein [unclassified Hymenobacter]MBO2031653.1 hypothetical protein [Hymenobacter sp. BT559]